MTKEGKDRKFMRLALRLALKGQGKTSPNPMVGSVIVSRSGEVLARGYHEKAGLPHAEILALSALKAAGKKAKGKTLYITLEPCVHFGRTPPCIDSIIEAGIKRVVIGAKDPNPLVAGKGIRKLRRNGIEVTANVLSKQCVSLNEGYNKFITTALPLVTLKLASTLDGRIATNSGESKWITGAKSRRLVHEMRAKADAVMVGSGTVIKDDPVLNVRGVKGSVDPVRVVLDTRLKTPLNSKLFNGGAPVIIYCSGRSDKKRQEALRALGATVAIVTETKEGLSLKRVLRDLARCGVTSVMIEGGARLAASALKAKLVDKIKIFYAPKLLGGDALSMLGALNVAKLKNAHELKEMRVRLIGGDILIEGYLK
jgi:diaminohydroxyphosphoribosylaminopyrimidine deaminase/5-amino-6-(5-phosphoribosylamino)uracil reductase